MLPDVINGAFEGLGAVFMMLNVKRAYQDKSVRGVHGYAMFFFLSWGFFNLFYYPHLGQIVSFWGGVALTTVQLFWVGQFIYYARKL